LTLEPVEKCELSCACCEVEEFSPESSQNRFFQNGFGKCVDIVCWVSVDGSVEDELSFDPTDPKLVGGDGVLLLDLVHSPELLLSLAPLFLEPFSSSFSSNSSPPPCLAVFLLL
jgi:hypothetical protein